MIILYNAIHPNIQTSHTKTKRTCTTTEVKVEKANLGCNFCKIKASGPKKNNDKSINAMETS